MSDEKELTWTTDIPTKPGLYWYRAGVRCDPTVVDVRLTAVRGVLVVRTFDSEGDLYFSPTPDPAQREFRSDGQWAGPLELPR